MLRIKKDLKDYLVAREMFGSNTQEQCKLVKKLREKSEIEPLCDGWSVIRKPNTDDCGWLIPNEILEEV
jgi:hypothetical protein